MLQQQHQNLELAMPLDIECHDVSPRDVSNAAVHPDMLVAAKVAPTGLVDELHGETRIGN